MRQDDQKQDRATAPVPIAIGFKSGEEIVVAGDIEALIKDLVGAVNKGAGVSTVWYCEPQIMLQLSQIEYVLPASSRERSK